jgi:hypothetical protein
MAEHDNSAPQDETAADVASTLTAGNGVPNSQSGVPGSAVDNSRKRPRQNNGDDDDDDDDSEPGRERRKIKIEFIEDKSHRDNTFHRRKVGIIKKVSAVVRHTLVGCRASFALLTSYLESQ